LATLLRPCMLLFLTVRQSGVLTKEMNGGSAYESSSSFVLGHSKITDMIPLVVI